MTRWTRIARDVLIVAAFFGLLLLIVARLDPSADVPLHGPFRAIDGDTLAAGNERLRLIGLDAPELDQSCEDGDGVAWPCGQEARQRLMRLVRADDVQCQGSGRDRYQRLLVTCHAGVTDINATLVRQGLAVASGDYEKEQSEARRNGQGIWAGNFERPRDWRSSRGMMNDPDLFESLLGWTKRLMGW